MPARATPRECVRGTSSALQGRRIPAFFQGAPIDSETQGVALGYHAAAPSAPEPMLYKPEFRSFDGWPFMRWLPVTLATCSNPAQSHRSLRIWGIVFVRVNSNVPM